MNNPFLSADVLIPVSWMVFAFLAALVLWFIVRRSLNSFVCQNRNDEIWLEINRRRLKYYLIWLGILFVVNALCFWSAFRHVLLSS